MTKGNTSPLSDYPPIPPQCLPEVPAGIQRDNDTHSFAYSFILSYYDSLIRWEVAMNKQNPSKKEKSCSNGTYII